jgi:hypothetical protein
MSPTHRGCATPQSVIGVVLFALGVMFLLNNLGYADARSWIRYWPAALILIGVLKLVQSRAVGPALAATLWLFAGTWLLLDNLHIVTLSFWDAVSTYWPLLLVAAGLSIVRRAFSRERFGVPVTDTRNAIHIMQVLGGTKRRISAPDFQQAELTAILGGVELDLTGAGMRSVDGGPPVAVVDLYAMWAGIDLRVPDGWVVDAQLTPLLAGFEDHTRPSGDPRAPRLILRGTCVMSGIEVKN